MSPFPCPSSPSPLKAFTPCKGIQFAESGKFLACGIRNPWHCYPEYSSRNPEFPLKFGIQNPIFTYKDWNPVRGIRYPRRQIQNPGLSWIPLHETKGCPHTLHASYSVFCIAQIVTLIRQVYSSLIKSCFVHVCSITSI